MTKLYVKTIQGLTMTMYAHMAEFELTHFKLWQLYMLSADDRDEKRESEELISLLAVKTFRDNLESRTPRPLTRESRSRSYRPRLL